MARKPSDTVLDIINERMTPNQQAKNVRGEVFTPIKFVQELLYGLRKSDPTKIWGINDVGEIFDDPSERVGGIPLDVWKNKESKWLDPANGIGNFPFVAFMMLDYQLAKTMINKNERRKHIVENMLYMIEYDIGNVNTSLKIFEQLVPGAKPNVCCADTIELIKDKEMKSKLGEVTFDVVMGNPPFQKPMLGKRFAGKTPSLWDIFVKSCIKLVKPNGFFVFITPPPWRKPNSPFWKPLTQSMQLVFLHVLNKRQSDNDFKVTQRIDMYILQNTTTKINAVILDELGKLNEIDISKLYFLPNYNYDDINKIVTDPENGIKIIYDTFYHSAPASKTSSDERPRMKPDDVYKYPVVHNINKNGLGLRYVKNNTLGHFGVSKVLLNKNEQQYPVNDFEGKYGMTEMTFGIPISSREEGDKIVEAINTERFRNIIKATKWGSFVTDYHMFKYFRPDFYNEFLKRSEGGRKTRRNRKRGTMRRL